MDTNAQATLTNVQVHPVRHLGEFTWAMFRETIASGTGEKKSVPTGWGGARNRFSRAGANGSKKKDGER